MSYRGAGTIRGPLRFTSTAPPGVSAASEGRIYFDTGTNQFLVSENGSAYAPLGASGTGWTDDGTVVRLTNVNDQVGIGTATPTATVKLEVDAAAGGFTRSASFLNGDVAVQAPIATTGSVVTATMTRTGGLGAMSAAVGFSTAGVTDPADPANSAVIGLLAGSPTRAGGSLSTLTALQIVGDKTGTDFYDRCISVDGQDLTIFTSGATLTDIVMNPARSSILNQTVATAGTPGAVSIINGAAHTGLDNLEVTDVDFSLDRTVTFSGGGATIPLQRSFVVSGPTLDAAAAQTIDIAAGLAVSAPVAMGNVTLTYPALSALFTGGPISCPGTGLNSQNFGLDTSASGEDSIAIGQAVNIVSVGSVAVGRNILLGPSTDNAVAIGNGITVTAFGGFVAIGQGVTTSFDAVAIGANTIAGDGAVSIGTNVNNAFTSIALGGYSYTTANFQFVAGRSLNNGGYAKEVYFGAGLRAPTDFSDYTIHGTGGYFAAAVADPAVAPTGSIDPSGGALGPGTYLVQYTYVAQTANLDPLGETLPSPTTLFTITTLGEKIILDPIANPGGNAYQLFIYVETAPASGVLRLYGNASFAAPFDITSPGTGVLPPVVNTTGNDGHGHVMTLRGGDSDSAGTGVAGAVVLSGGNALGATGDAGSATVQGGTPTDGNGASVFVTGSNGVGTNRNGGSINLSAGDSTGSGTPGSIVFSTAGGVERVRVVPDGLVGVATATPNSTLDCDSSFALGNIRNISTNTTLDTTFGVVFADATGGVVTVTLPPVSGVTRRHYVIKKVDASINSVIIAGDGADTIDGSATKILVAQYDSLWIASNGTEWFIL